MPGSENGLRKKPCAQFIQITKELYQVMHTGELLSILRPHCMFEPKSMSNPALVQSYAPCSRIIRLPFVIFRY